MRTCRNGILGLVLFWSLIACTSREDEPKDRRIYSPAYYVGQCQVLDNPEKLAEASVPHKSIFAHVSGQPNQLSIKKIAASKASECFARGLAYSENG